jgi:hemolysin activation/secretion protein
VFYDQARVHTLAKGDSAVRNIAGAGVGLRYQRGPWSADAALAWRTRGGRPSDANERDAKPRLWLTAAYRF